MNHIPRSLFELGAEKSRPAVWMVLAVKCKKTAEDENIFVGGSDENDSESDLLAREKRGGLEQRGQRRSAWAARTSPLKTAGSSVSSFFIAKGSSL